MLAITSPDRLYADWRSAQQKRARGEPDSWSHIERLLAPLSADAGIVTVIDGHPMSLSWLGGVRRHSVHALGVSAFGQSGDLPDLYRTYGIDAEAIAAAAHEVVTRRAHAPL